MKKIITIILLIVLSALAYFGVQHFAHRDNVKIQSRNSTNQSTSATQAQSSTQSTQSTTQHMITNATTQNVSVYFYNSANAMLSSLNITANQNVYIPTGTAFITVAVGKTTVINHAKIIPTSYSIHDQNNQWSLVPSA